MIKDTKSKELINRYIDELQKELEQGKSERLTKYLEFVSNFRNYSFYNTLLIHFQEPEASRIAGFKTWDNLGYKIKKGSKAIRILAPRFYKYYQEDDKKVFINKGDKIDDTEVIEGIYFIGVNVFDISQTDKTDKAKELVDNFFYNIGNNFENKYLNLKSIIESEGITVIETNKTNGAEGYARQDNVIAIKSNNDFNNKLLTLIHEWGHIKLHINNNKFEFTKEDKEVQAEAISYLVGKFLGLSNPFSSDYILTWGRDSQALRHNLKYVVETAGKMIEKIKEYKTNRNVA